MKERERIYVYLYQGDIRSIGGLETAEQAWEDFLHDEESLHDWIEDWGYDVDENVEDWDPDCAIYLDFIESGGDGGNYEIQVWERPKGYQDSKFSEIF